MAAERTPEPLVILRQLIPGQDAAFFDAALPRIGDPALHAGGERHAFQLLDEREDALKVGYEFHGWSFRLFRSSSVPSHLPGPFHWSTTVFLARAS